MPGECSDRASEIIERDCGQPDGCTSTGERCLGCGVAGRNRLAALLEEAGKQSKSSAEHQPRIEKKV